MPLSSRAGERRLLTSASFVWVWYALHLGIAFFMSPLLVRGLGDSRYGIWSLVESVLAYLMLFDVGLGASVVRYVAKFEAGKDTHSLNRLFSTCLVLFGSLGAAVMLIVVAIALPWARPLGVPAEYATDARWLLLILGCSVGVQLPLGVFPAVLDGLGRFPTKICIQIAGLLSRTALFVEVIRSGGGLLPLALAASGCSLAEHLLMVVAVRQYLPELRFRWALADWSTVRMIRGYSLDAFWIMVAHRIAFQTDAIVIFAFLGSPFVTSFVVAARLTEYAKNAFRSAVMVLTPAVSELEARGEAEQIRHLLLRATRIVLYLVVPIELGLFLLGKPFLALWQAPEFVARSYPSLAILALPVALAISQSVSVRTLYGIGQIRWLAWAALVQAGVNLLLSVALVGPMGIEGVALGTTLPNLLYGIAVALHVCRRLEIPVGQYLYDTHCKPLLLAPVPACIWWLGTQDFQPTWAGFVVRGTVGVVGYLLPALLLEVGPAALWQRVKQHGSFERLRNARSLEARG